MGPSPHLWGLADLGVSGGAELTPGAPAGVRGRTGTEPVPQVLEGVRAARPGVDTNGPAVLLRGTLPEDTSPHTYKHSDTSTQVPGFHTFMGPLRAHASTKTQMLLVGRTSSSQTPRPGRQPRAPGLISQRPGDSTPAASAESHCSLRPRQGWRSTATPQPGAHSPAPRVPKRTCRHKTMGRQAYLLVMELFLSLRVSSRCCSSTMNLDKSSGVLGGIKNTCQCWLCPEGGLVDTRRRPKATPATGGSQAWGGLGPVHRPRSSGVWSCALTATWAHTASR